MQLTNIQDKLIGNWIYEHGILKPDENALQIEWLMHNQLIKLAADKSGWNILYVDPDDNRFWELIYLQSEMHGGGPPSLIQMTEEDARSKYSF